MDRRIQAPELHRADAQKGQNERVERLQRALDKACEHGVIPAQLAEGADHHGAHETGIAALQTGQLLAAGEHLVQRLALFQGLGQEPRGKAPGLYARP